MKTITIDEKSIFSICAGQLDVEDFCKSLTLPDASESSNCISVNDHGFVISVGHQPTDSLLTISLLPDGPLFGLSEESRVEAFGRLIRCASRIITGKTRSIPEKWRPYHRNSLLSFQADRFFRNNDGGKTNAGRIVLDISQTNGTRIFAFLLDKDSVTELDDITPDRDFHEDALSNIAEALSISERPAVPNSLGNSVHLDDDKIDHKIKGFLTTDEWYETRLTLPQRRFVDHPLSNSIRLVGPAGTGKTIALVTKCIREVKSRLDEDFRVLFLTHALATADDVENLILSMEPILGPTFIQGDKPRIKITTLHGIAEEVMTYGLSSIGLISIDGHEGRNFQADTLSEAIEEYKNGDWITLKKHCSAPFNSYMSSSPDSGEHRFFIWELMNEFACVLDAEGVRSGNGNEDLYLRESRKSWMMHLSCREERKVVVSLYEIFRRKLREMKVIGSDQMVTDFLNHLDTFRWEATRSEDGFSAIFVDELHLFNRQERMIFKHLLRLPDAPPTVLMAYDAKQSPRDTFLNLPSLEAKNLDLWKDAKLGVVEKIELVDVFRYTPEITLALAKIDEQFPGQNLDDEWPQYTGISQIESGPKPIACELESQNATYSVVFKRAKERQNSLGRNGRVAILCASNDEFLKYLNYSAYKNDYVAITSRDDAATITKSAKKFIFSMPEYVAGLQFETVYVIDANKSEIPEGAYAAAAARKFISQLYLGASRAERVLEIYARKDKGGLSSLLSIATRADAILLVSPENI